MEVEYCHSWISIDKGYYYVEFGAIILIITYTHAHVVQQHVHCEP